MAVSHAVYQFTPMPSGYYFFYLSLILSQLPHRCGIRDVSQIYTLSLTPSFAKGKRGGMEQEAGLEGQVTTVVGPADHL